MFYQGATIVVSGFLLENDGVTKIKNFASIDLNVLVYSPLQETEIIIPKSKLTLQADGLIVITVLPTDTANLYGNVVLEMNVKRDGKTYVGLKEVIFVHKSRSKKL